MMASGSRHRLHSRCALALLLVEVLLFSISEAQEDSNAVQSSGWNSDSGQTADTAATSNGDTEDDPYPELSWPRAGGPIFDPAGGLHRDQVEVLIYSLMGSDASLHYTTDGTTPTNKSTKFETKLQFTGVGDYVVKAIVAAPERRDSVVSEQIYRIREDAAAPTVQASIVDPDFPEAANFTEATENYLGSFEDAVMLKVFSSTPHCDIRYTADGSAPSESSNTTSGDNGKIVLRIDRTAKNFTIKVQAIPKTEAAFPSSTGVYYVEVHPRPPVPAYTYRHRNRFYKQLIKAFRTLSKERGRDRATLRPTDLKVLYTRILNPDNGKCPDCYISKEEEAKLDEEIEALKVQEGLHLDPELDLHIGFLSRGSPFKFMMDTNSRMQHFRWALRNSTLEGASSADL